jgi:S-DNA-T family DNA segregation ATPase FtsK/SpoIIIE
MGMMSYTVRFIDIPEVERITDFIGSQKAYATAYLLPEFVGEDSGINLDIDISEILCLEKQPK